MQHPDSDREAAYAPGWQEGNPHRTKIVQNLGLTLETRGEFITQQGLSVRGRYGIVLAVVSPPFCNAS